jgi:uncharacterized protein involved in tolerance to divalent cations
MLWCPGYREFLSLRRAWVHILIVVEQLVPGRLSLRKTAPSWFRRHVGLITDITRSIVVDHLQTFFKDSNVAVTCIFCNYKEQTTQTATNLVASLLKQIVQDCVTTSDNVKSFYKHHQNRDTRPRLVEFTKALESEIGTYAKTFVVVDAIDECPEDNGTRAILLKTLQSLAGTVNVIVTSRDLASIARQFQGTQRLDIHAKEDDMRRYIEERIANVPRRHLMTLRETIIKKVLENARGM